MTEITLTMDYSVKYPGTSFDDIMSDLAVHTKFKEILSANSTTDTHDKGRIIRFTIDGEHLTMLCLRHPGLSEFIEHYNRGDSIR